MTSLGTTSPPSKPPFSIICFSFSISDWYSRNMASFWHGNLEHVQLYIVYFCFFLPLDLHLFLACSWCFWHGLHIAVWTGSGVNKSIIFPQYLPSKFAWILLFQCNYKFLHSCSSPHHMKLVSEVYLSTSSFHNVCHFHHSLHAFEWFFPCNQWWGYIYHINHPPPHSYCQPGKDRRPSSSLCCRQESLGEVEWACCPWGILKYF